jgi:phenylalanine-4-hydroxylase
MSTLRGDYSNIGADYAVEQRFGSYSATEHALYRRLYERQSAMLPRYACAEFQTALAKLDAAAGIPRFDLISKQLRAATGWEIVAVPGLIPDEVFFTHLSQRRFPVTVWLRKPEEFDYIVEPDVFHDFFGHVPLLFDAEYAEHMEAYGHGGLKALQLDALKYLARFYWFTIEFGLMKSSDGVRAYGAGLLSSGGELPYAVESAVPLRPPLDLIDTMGCAYEIDRYQTRYYTIESFTQLLEMTSPDFTPHYAALKTAMK